MREAILWDHEGDRIRCHVCPNACLIADGGRGVCGVRENHGGVLKALTYGLVSSVAVDPIEKKPVFHYRPGTRVLSLGSAGCSMRCGHCQNWQISRARPTADGLSTLMPGEVVPLACAHGCEGVAFTYNEPVIWIEYVLDAAVECHASGLFTVMVTNGFITAEALDVIAPHLDVWRVDVKGFSDETYRWLCKVHSVAPVLAAAERAKQRWGLHVEVVTNVIPGINDDDETLHGIAAWIARALGADTPWHVTRFFPYLDLADRNPTPIATLRRARDIGLAEGLHFVYLGNVDEPGGEDTKCPQCGAIALGRDGYTITAHNTRGGACAACGTPLGIVET